MFFNHSRIFWPYFYQIIVPKMAICYSNFTVIACFWVIFVIIIIKITIIIIIIIIASIIIIIKKFSVIRAKRCFWRPKKEDLVARIGVTGFWWFERKRFFPVSLRLTVNILNPASWWTFPATKYWKHNLVHYNLKIFLTEQRFGCRKSFLCEFYRLLRLRFVVKF